MVGREGEREGGMGRTVRVTVTLRAASLPHNAYIDAIYGLVIGETDGRWSLVVVDTGGCVYMGKMRRSVTKGDGR